MDVLAVWEVRVPKKGIMRPRNQHRDKLMGCGLPKGTMELNRWRILERLTVSHKPSCATQTSQKDCLDRKKQKKQGAIEAVHTSDP